jgi:hypothetical protein
MALFLIKLAHSLIFLFMSACVLFVLYSGVANKATKWSYIAIVLLIAEGIALILNDGRCPLATLAEQLGAESGTVSDIFLPAWFAPHVVPVCTIPFLIGVGLIVGRRLRR